jgi:UDP-glucose 4-epimerase
MDSFDGAILVTGGAGYVGSHAVKALQLAGFQAIVLDNLVYGHRDLVENVLGAKLIVGDVGDRQLLDSIFSEAKICAVMHFAAYAYVGESVTDPAKYYSNNVAGTITLLEAMRMHGVSNFVFSSTCATYGVPHSIPISEDHSQHPINPYGSSKLMVERILKDYSSAYGIESIVFRYFNAAGADPDGELGEDHDPETHLIPLVLQAAAGKRSGVSIFGSDYDTSDGTCIRDYIHVADLAQAHILGLQYLLENHISQVFNLGNGNGFSVREVIETAKRITGKEIPTTCKPRRVGDPPILIGSSSKAHQVLNWEPKYADLGSILSHAWHWHQHRHF